MTPDVETVLRCCPQIYFACHMRHVRDEATDAVLSAHQARILDRLDEVEATSFLTWSAIWVSPLSPCRSRWSAWRAAATRKRKQALRGLELLAEASLEMVASGDLRRLLNRGAA